MAAWKFKNHLRMYRKYQVSRPPEKKFIWWPSCAHTKNYWVKILRTSTLYTHLKVYTTQGAAEMSSIWADQVTIDQKCQHLWETDKTEKAENAGLHCAGSFMDLCALRLCLNEHEAQTQLSLFFPRVSFQGPFLPTFSRPTPDSWENTHVSSVPFSILFLDQIFTSNQFMSCLK
jgi:hypothetical protein